LTKPSQHLLITLLTCGLLVFPFTAQADGNPVTGKAAHHESAPVITEEALHAWFKEQDKVLDEILVRLSRIESLVADIHELLIRLPDYVQPAALPATTVATQNSPASQPAPVKTPVPAAQAAPGFLDQWMPQLAGAGLLALLLFWWSRRRSARQISQALEADTENHQAEKLAPHAPAEEPAPLPVTTPPAPAAPSAPSASKPPPVSKPTAVPAPDTGFKSTTAFAAQVPSSQSDQALELAEIMLAMGLGSGAVQTLAEQIHNEPKQALRHWLKLLEIYRKNGQQEEFERSAEELRQHFNVQPENWKSPADSYRGLESFPHIAKRLTELWRTTDCLVYMQNLLDDNRGGARAGFPQTVAEELLLLTGMLKAEGSHT